MRQILKSVSSSSNVRNLRQKKLQLKVKAYEGEAKICSILNWKFYVNHFIITLFR